ncbi:MAG TPA: NotI family restriction endonuclease [Methylomirabilota bacterium]|nr:NotI family restriction endonuclease [Methylomirabilota bacterium]
MALSIFEFFGFSPDDMSPEALEARRLRWCPFLNRECTKKYPDGVPMGSCSLKPTKSAPVICCPIRLHAHDFQILRDVANFAFQTEARLVRGLTQAHLDGSDVVVFGKGWGKELRLPSRQEAGSYFVDWILARLTSSGTLDQFVAVEVQTMDTIGSYRGLVEAYNRGDFSMDRSSKAGINWENVMKRIVPQIIWKGHVLRREPRCGQGLFFITPGPVHRWLFQRLGGERRLEDYHLQAGALTFQWYELSNSPRPGEPRDLLLGGRYTTTVDQVVKAFTAPDDLPEARVYERAITETLRNELNA